MLQRAGLLVGASALLVPGLGAQQRLLIPEPVACSTCRIVVSDSVALRDSSERAAVAPVTVRRDPSGRYWVFRTDEPLAHLYSAQGRFVNVVGRSGSGPGEYRGAYDVLALPGDSLLVLDFNERRGTVLDASLRAVRTIPLTLAPRNAIVAAWPGVILANASGAQDAGASRSLRVLDFSRSPVATVREFGPPDGELPSQYGFVRQHLTAPRRGRLWASGAAGYALYQWTTAGALERSWYREPEWLPQPRVTSLGSPTIAPTAMIGGISVDSAGLLWVFARIPGRTWRDGWPRVAPGTMEVRSRDIVMDKLYTTLIEVIDPAKGRVVARQARDEYIVNALPDAGAVFYRTDADGYARVVIRRLGLVER